MERIEWGALPTTPWITNGFLTGNSDCRELLGGDYRIADDLNAVAISRSAYPIQSGLGDAILAGYNNTPLSSATLKNIELLNHPETLAIVTGQQVGIFGGPLYTWYKTLTTVIAAQRLHKETGRNVVPIFWMETPDADFSEINRIAFPPRKIKKTDYYRIVYNPERQVTGKSISHHQLTPEIIDCVRDVASELSQYKYNSQYVNYISEFYTPGRSVVTAFRLLLNKLFGSDGIVIVDPSDPVMIQRALPFWEKVLAYGSDIRNPFRIVSDRIVTRGLPLQAPVHGDLQPYYLTDQDGFRKRIFCHKHKWTIGRNGDPTTPEKLFALPANGEGFLNPTVLLRPLLQDFLLPTWIYVGGAAEIAYNAQIGLAYEKLAIPRPLIMPRIGATLVEPCMRTALKKFNWSVTDCLAGRQILLSGNEDSQELLRLFQRGVEQWQGWHRRLINASENAHIDLQEELDKMSQQIEGGWGRLRNSAIRKVEARTTEQASTADFLLQRLVPEGVLQERFDNVLYYLSLYGDQLRDKIIESAVLTEPSHLVIDLEVN